MIALDFQNGICRFEGKESESSGINTVLVSVHIVQEFTTLLTHVEVHLHSCLQCV